MNNPNAMAIDAVHGDECFRDADKMIAKLKPLVIDDLNSDGRMSDAKQDFLAYVQTNLTCEQALNLFCDADNREELADKVRDELIADYIIENTDFLIEEYGVAA